MACLRSARIDASDSFLLMLQLSGQLACQMGPQYLHSNSTAEVCLDIKSHLNFYIKCGL